MKKVTFFYLLFFINFISFGQDNKQRDSLIKLLAKLKDTSQITVLNQLSSIYNVRGMRDSVDFYYKKSSFLLGKIGDKRRISELNYLISRNYRHQQKFDEAIKILFEIIETSKKEKFIELEVKSKMDIGYIYSYTGRDLEALKFLKESEIELLKFKDTTQIINLNTQLITCLAKNGDTVNSKRYFFSTLIIFDKFEFDYKSKYPEINHILSRKLAFIHNSLLTLVKEEELQILLKITLDLNKKVINDKIEFQNFQINILLSEIYERQKKYKEASNYAEKAINLYREESGDYTQISELYKIVANSSAKIGQYNKAYNSLITFNRYNDSVYRIETTNQTNTIENEYKLKKKEDDIAQLQNQKKSNRLIIILSISAFLLSLGFLIFTIKSKRLQRKILLKESEISKNDFTLKLIEIEQTALRAQMNPHFIFNCLNSVQRFIGKNDENELNLYITTFASLIRQTLENSGSKFISLKEEILYLETYIKMEQLKSNYIFDYEINFDNKIDLSEIFIPNMIVQPFIENAIQHGIFTKDKSKGKIIINFSVSNELIISINDNGIGYKSKIDKKSEHKSMGSEITFKRIKMYNDINSDKIKLEIIDKSDMDDNGFGTLVILKFPINS